jgi:hypothetical protein
MAMFLPHESGGGREVKVYDPTRQPQNWNELLAPSQCAVFFKRVDSEAPLFPSGASVARFRDCTFLLFDSLEEARRTCEAKVHAYPYMRCEVFDWRGKAQPPLLTILHPDVAQKDELSEQSVRKRKILAILLFIAALPLFLLDRRYGGGLILPTFLGLTMILAGSRLLYWNTARRQRLNEEEQGVRAHLEREQQNDQEQKSIRRPGN